MSKEQQSELEVFLARRAVDAGLLDAIARYLAQRPYAEVAGLMRVLPGGNITLAVDSPLVGDVCAKLGAVFPPPEGKDTETDSS